MKPTPTAPARADHSSTANAGRDALLWLAIYVAVVTAPLFALQTATVERAPTAASDAAAGEGIE